MRSDDISLNQITAVDIEDLRRWKNANSQFFFHTQIISEREQKEWFENFSEREDDYMFVVRYQEKNIGCMGIRLKDEGWEVYNVILGDLSYGKNGIMSEAFESMLSFALNKNYTKIFLKVLKRNPAIKWYEKNKFWIVGEEASHFLMTFKGGER